MCALLMVRMMRMIITSIIIIITIADICHFCCANRAKILRSLCEQYTVLKKVHLLITITITIITITFITITITTITIITIIIGEATLLVNCPTQQSLHTQMKRKYSTVMCYHSLNHHQHLVCQTSNVILFWFVGNSGKLRRKKAFVFLFHRRRMSTGTLAPKQSRACPREDVMLRSSAKRGQVATTCCFARQK